MAPRRKEVPRGVEIGDEAARRRRGSMVEATEAGTQRYGLRHCGQLEMVAVEGDF